ncbi:Sensor histidine kinase LiaS [Actinomadura rubteroloni]|uniref:histidine kinase n=1 Tax=Actinomadura rubteroloni TaxID=1926885 RepID=A0A2P4URL5_9ACTN|nr:histidine kinase [Actinomadura rubteroloni]POM27693.1 Sensor histidine kinase LiaS [Actinomadura rubteroloni]
MTEQRGTLERVHSAGGCLLRLAGWGATALVLLASVVLRQTTPVHLAVDAVTVAAAIGALASRNVLRWAAGAAAASIAVTLLAAATHSPGFGAMVFLEVSWLLVLVVRVVWKAPQPRLPALTALTGGAVAFCAFRSPGAAVVLVAVAPLGGLVVVAIGTGLYLRALDARRVRALAGARRDERLELARDLHDFVAHHVTGIVVQAQAARFAAGSAAAQSPEQLDRMLASIEKAGGEALASMRRMVGLLRDASDDPAGLRPVGGLDQVIDLVERWTDPPASLIIDRNVGAPPPEVATTLHRIVQEALTNVRKHAADATHVRVAITRSGPDAVTIEVTDDGQGRGRLLPSGGFGLAGLDERVASLGGRLSAGPGPHGGWRVVAVLPIRDVLRESPV